MMEADLIQQWIDATRVAGVSHFHFEQDQTRIEFTRAAGPGAAHAAAYSSDIGSTAAVAPPPASTDPDTLAITAEAVGRFHRTHPLRKTPFTPDGTAVSPRTILGMLAIGMLYRPVYATATGTVVAASQAADCPTPHISSWGDTLLSLRQTAQCDTES